MILDCIIIFSYIKSALYSELALIPPTLAPAIKTYSGFSKLKKLSTLC